ncbi:MAG TPA: hypothetical protein VK209_02535 [Candidatus Sulfotelmatobacter sp.]|nr:hypothetical protein [Candidatus Sulfotelmatobacter sp.]
MESEKSKMTVTVDQRIVDWIDKQVEIQRFKDRSHVVEVALMHFIESER